MVWPIVQQLRLYIAYSQHAVSALLVLPVAERYRGRGRHKSVGADLGILALALGKSSAGESKAFREM